MREEAVKRIAWGAAIAVTIVTGSPALAQEKPGFKDTPMLPDGKWRVHDADRPYPTIVTPGAVPAYVTAGRSATTPATERTSSRTHS